MVEIKSLEVVGSSTKLLMGFTVVHFAAIACCPGCFGDFLLCFTHVLSAISPNILRLSCDMLCFLRGLDIHCAESEQCHFPFSRGLSHRRSVTYSTLVIHSYTKQLAINQCFVNPDS